MRSGSLGILVLIFSIGCASTATRDPCDPGNPDHEEHVIRCFAPWVLTSCFDVCRERGGPWQVLIERPDPLDTPGLWAGPGGACRCADQFTTPPDRVELDTRIGGIDTSPIGWLSLNDALARAMGSDSRVLLVYAAAACPASRALWAEFFSDPEIAAVVRALVVPALIIDRGRISEEQSIASLKEAYRISGAPTLIIIDPVDGEVARQLGWSNAEDTLKFLQTSASRGVH